MSALSPYQAFVVGVKCRICQAPEGELCRYPGKRLPANAAHVHLERVTYANALHEMQGGDSEYIDSLVSPLPPAVEARES